MKTPLLSLLIGCAAGFLPQISRAALDSPYISELVAVGNTSHPDGDGDGSDWLEIHNPGLEDLDLGGYALTDDPAELTKWVFPATPLPAGGYLVVFASDKDRAVAGSELHTNFKLASSGEYLALVDPDGSTVVSQFSPAFPPQVEAYSYGIGTGGAVGFFKSSTPGAANGPPLEAPLLAPVITPAGATFIRSLVVELTTEVPGGVIRYTTNGGVPSAASPLYTDPLKLGATTHLRAAVFDPVTGARGALAGSHFLRLGSTASGGLGAPSTFTSDLPIMVVENFGAGSIPGPGATLQTARLAVHEVDPATGRSSLAANPDATMRMGIRRRGQSSAGFPKAQYRVELRNELEEDFDYPLLGLPAESDWVLNGPWTDKALIRNPLAFELGRTIGIAAPRTSHFELFLSTDGGDLGAAEYVGVYILVESIKVGKDRTNIASLDPRDNVQPDVTGGYLMRIEPPGIANDGPRATGWNTVEILDPIPGSRSQLGYIGKYLDDFAATLGWTHGAGANDRGVVNNDPLTGYPAYIDVDSFVHLLLINELLRDQDAYVRSDYMYKDRGGKLHKGPLWDYNLTAGTGCCFDNRNTAGWQYRDSYNRGGRDHAYEPDWFVPLLRDPDFLQRYIDRWGELRRGGVLELNRLFAVIDGLADPLAESALRNFKRWDTLGSANVGFPTPVTATWEEQVEFIKIWLATRMAWIDSQFVASPRLIPASGAIAAGTHIAVGSEQFVYFTTDGSDPRLPGGGINLEAVRLSPSGADLPVTFIERGSAWRYLDNGADLGSSGIVATQPDYGPGNWKHPAFDDSQWAAGSGIFGFAGTLTGATVATPLAPGPGSAPFITYYFRKTINIPDAVHVVSLSCEVLRDDGVIIYLNGREVARSNMNGGPTGTADLAATSVADGSEAAYLTLSLNPADLIDGDNVIAVELHQAAPVGADAGFDLALTGTIPAAGSGFELASTALVTSRARHRTSGWSAPTKAVYIVGTPADAGNLAVTELNYHPQNPSPAETAANPTYRDDDFEFIELKNLSGSAIDLSGASFIDGIEFTFPVPTVVPPGGYVLVVESAPAFEERYGPGLPVAGVYAGKMNNDGETLRLIDVTGNDIFQFTFNDIWHPTTDGLGRSLVPADEENLPGDYGNPASWRPSIAISGSPGRADPRATYAGWLVSNFTAAELADPAITGPQVDLDGNGFGTLMSYALGLDPRRAEPDKYPSSAIVSDIGGQYLSFTFRRRKGALDLAYKVQVSDNLIDWIETTQVFGEVTDNGDGTETVTLRDTSPLRPNDRRFMRLVVEQGGVTTYAGWLASEFTAAELADPAITGPQVDLDGNGFGTLISYALDLDPRRPEPDKYPSSAIVTDTGGQYLSLSFRRRKGALDLAYKVQVSDNLVDWIETTQVFGKVTDNGDGTETVTLRDTSPLSPNSRRFIRLAVASD